MCKKHSSFSDNKSSNFQASLSLIKVQRLVKGHKDNGSIFGAIKFFFAMLLGKSNGTHLGNDIRNSNLCYEENECIICFNEIEKAKFHFEPIGCDHKTCITCIRKYFEQAVNEDHHHYQESYETMQCPGSGCKGELLPYDVLPIIFTKEKDISNWWSKALTKAFIRNKIVCPFSDCGAIFDVDPALSRKCTFTECYECHKGFCIACQNKWHQGLIKIFDDQDETLKTFLKAEKSKWSRCPSCFHIVEKSRGCLDILCRCGVNFCYRCGGKMRKHNDCENKCHLFNSTKLANVRKAMFVEKRKDSPAVVAA